MGTGNSEIIPKQCALQIFTLQFRHTQGALVTAPRLALCSARSATADRCGRMMQGGVELLSRRHVSSCQPVRLSAGLRWRTGLLGGSTHTFNSNPRYNKMQRTLSNNMHYIFHLQKIDSKHCLLRCVHSHNCITAVLFLISFISACSLESQRARAESQ